LFRPDGLLVIGPVHGDAWRRAFLGR
jgi:hypothetical protein